MARWCCAKDMPCECGGRTEKGYKVCKACRARNRAERWAKLYENAVEWDGEAPLADWDGDLFVFSLDDIISWLEGGDEGDGRKLEDLRLVLAEEMKPPHFSLAEFLCDELPDGFDERGRFDDIDRVVNDEIEGGRPWSVTPSNRPVTLESVRAFLGEDAS
jgi:hypothetical protein